MTSTVSKLAVAEQAKLETAPARAVRAPMRSALLWVEGRNALLDAVFYNIEAIPTDDVARLAAWDAPEGAMLLVPPSGKGPIAVFAEMQEFLDAGGGEAKALAVAGVGSSAIGSAAFARDIADALGGPVAAVVSGYGLSDVVTEALGGFFWFGALNSLRHSFEGLDRVARSLSFRSGSLTSVEADSFLRLSKDTATLIALFESSDFKIPLLVGHSKGNLVLSEALYALRKQEKLAAFAARTQIITVSAKVGMPAEFIGKVFDVMGQFDNFGALNSRPDIKADYLVPGAWHSTNPKFPWGMGIDVTKVIRTVLPMLGKQAPPSNVSAGASTILDLPQWMTGNFATAPWMLARPMLA
ncbi:hypothetical protein HT136_08015 [Novosphingobium profundi]|uniref:hypothetical protein n=1 Tax=Novosphingobium profundi TaxID=1774954 RepID=UPI001BD91AE5|nr:hypothetical protein [Novosphingobium profundi]MBT0668312.1 hypothetical protein [Novosphingobium profundi]